MKDLSRLLDEQGTDPLEADLLRLARSEGPSGESRRRILAGLGVAVAAGTVSSASSASAAAPGGPSGSQTVASRSLLKWGVFGSVVVGAAAVALLILGHRAPEAPPAPVSPAVVAAVPAPAAAPAAAPAVTSETAPVTKLEDLPTLPDSSASDTGHTAGPSLADEVLAIKAAKSALAAGNAGDAIRQLDGYRAHFPHGRLAQEANVVRIEALLKSGNQATANALADRFLAAHADSPYAARVHTLVGH